MGDLKLVAEESIVEHAGATPVLLLATSSGIVLRLPELFDRLRRVEDDKAALRGVARIRPVAHSSNR